MLHTTDEVDVDPRTYPCYPNPEPWFSSSAEDRAYAKRGCRRCPVKLRCLEDALEQERLMGMRLHGIHGGLTERQRTKIEVKRTA